MSTSSPSTGAQVNFPYGKEFFGTYIKAAALVASMPAKKKTAKKTAKKTPKKAAKKAAKPVKKDREASEEEEGEQRSTVRTAKAMVKAVLGGEQVITEDSDAARDLYAQSRYGDLDKGIVQLSLLEALYLSEKGKLKIVSPSGRAYTPEGFIRKAKRLHENFWTKYVVFRDMRDRGYIVKTALKFGADFRVYDRGVKPGEDHAKWVLFAIHESNSLTWHDFAAKNRVAHSTKKRLLIGVVDEESDVTYFEIAWKRP
ncbi:tRNA-intron lyase [Candidatus Woesearchaeota archaeon]|nr:tRNA-intron lyase [Candidatus Woesearchaeota archaeon]